MQIKGKVIVFFIIISILAVTVVTAFFMPKKYACMQYLEIVERYCRRFNVDVYHALATIEVESGGDKSAVSRVGAVGLMQLMPKTALWIGEKIGERVTYDSLFDAEVNVKLGVAYLSYLSDIFDREYVFCAYNAGEGVVRKWLNDGGEIEYVETRNYVEKIKKTIRGIKDIKYLY